MKSFLHFFLHIFIAASICFVFFSCGVSHILPIETQYNIKDSTTIHYVDSTVYIPVERIVDVVAEYDTLHLESSKAKAEAWVDTTTHTLKGKLENKSGVEYKYIYKDRIEYRDSVVTKEVPVEVVKEVVKNKHYWYESILWVCSLLFIVPLVIKILRRKLCLIKE